MQDRVPLYPGRVKMTPVAGQANTYDMVRADDPTQAGTPINKATLLKDATAALFGKTDAAVPDDILSLLSKSALAQVVPKYTKHTISLSNLAIGDTIPFSVNGKPKEFLVVNKGLPSSIYDNSCNGTWLLMKDIYEKRAWGSSNVNDYANSTIHSYLNSTFLNLLDSNVKNAIKQVKIPYRAGSGSGNIVTSGANGLLAKIFLLSSTEVNLVFGYEPTNEGACLPYFSGTTQNGPDGKRVASLSGGTTEWWLRSPYCKSDSGSEKVILVSSNGSWSTSYCPSSHGIRPVFILPADYDYQYTYYTDESGYIYTEQEYETALTDVLGTQLTVGVQIVTGSYVGTGTYGQANPNTLTFGFAPKVVCVFGPTPGVSPLIHYAMILTRGAGFRSYDASNTIGYYIVHEITGNTISWYTTQTYDSGPGAQGNIANSTYNYIAIG